MKVGPTVITMKASSCALSVLLVLLVFVLGLYLVESGRSASMADREALAKRRRESVEAAKRKLRAPKVAGRRISLVGSRRRRVGSADGDNDDYEENWDYDDEYEESGSGGEGGFGYVRGGRGRNNPYTRKKRFYQLEVGCLKGYYCCENPLCRPYCSLCNDPPSGYGTGYGTGYGHRHHGYGGYGGGYRKKKKRRRCKKGKDANMDGICDKDQMDEDDELDEKMPQEGSTTTTTTTTTTPTTTEEDLSEVMAQAGSDDSQDDDEDLSEVMAQAGSDDDDDGGGGPETTTEAAQQGQLEFTHHIYEEYQPSVPVESKPPIILQTIPHYSVANYFSLSKHHHPNLPPPPPPPPPSPRPVHHHRHHTTHHVSHNLGPVPGPPHHHGGHEAHHHHHTSVSHGTGPGGLTGPGFTGPGPFSGTVAPGLFPTPGVPPPLPSHGHHGASHHHRQHFHGGTTAGPSFAPHGLNPIPDGPFPLDVPPRQFHPMGAGSSKSLVKYGADGNREPGSEGEEDGGLFYGDIQAIIRGGKPTATSSLPQLPPRQGPHASPSSTLFDEEALANFASTAAGGTGMGSPPVINAGTPPSTSSPMVFTSGLSNFAAGMTGAGGAAAAAAAAGGGVGGGAGNPYLYNVPLPQTIIYEQNQHQQQNFAPTHPPQPLLKYHLIRHSYPAKPDQEYFADVPAFMPGPPYLPKALPSIKAPQIKRPPPPAPAAYPIPQPPVAHPSQAYPSHNRPVPYHQQPQEQPTKKKKKKKSGFGALVNNLFG